MFWRSHFARESSAWSVATANPLVIPILHHRDLDSSMRDGDEQHECQLGVSALPKEVQIRARIESTHTTEEKVQGSRKRGTVSP